MENDFRTAALKASVLCVGVVCVSTVAASLPRPCIHDLKDVFVNCPGPAHFQAKGRTRNKFLFDNNKTLFFLQPKQPGSKLQRRHLSVI